MSRTLYSDTYEGAESEFRNVVLSDEAHARLLALDLPEGATLTEEQWRRVGVAQGIGWEHYATHAPEPNVLLFRRPKRRMQLG